MNINKKFLNWSAWITLLMTYILPFQSTDGLATKFGYPFSFLTVYKTSVGTSLLTSQNINVLVLALNIMIIYFVIYFASAQFIKLNSYKKTN